MFAVGLKKKKKEKRSFLEKININTEFIKLDSFLKYIGAVGSGAEAKILILDGKVKVNDEVEIQRGKKIRKEDVVSFCGESYLVI